MIRFLLKLSIPLIIAFTTFSIAARALGITQPPNPALAGFTEGCEDIPQPCWYGIVPGVTRSREAREILSQLGYSINDDIVSGGLQLQTRPINYTPCGSLYADIDPRSDTLADFDFDLCGAITLGEFISQFGIPNVTDIGYLPCGIRLTFANYYLELVIDESTQLLHHVKRFALISNEGLVIHETDYGTGTKWIGSLPIVRYKNRLAVHAVCQ